jgi:microcystin-dependent protein
MPLARLLSKVNTDPTGLINPFAGSSAPVGWLLCDGSAISRTTYSELFAVISTTYGVGNGTTTFNLPNLSGKIPFGRDTTQTEFDTLGETGGVKSITLSTSQIPVHSHANTLSNNGSLSQGHVHYNEGQGGAMRAAIGATGSDPGSIGYVPSGHISPGPTVIGAYTLVGFGWTTAGRGFNHYTPSYGYVSDRSSDTTIGISNANAGTGSSYNKMNPYVVLNYIIRF